jgi:hypothetical protein
LKSCAPIAAFPWPAYLRERVGDLEHAAELYAEASRAATSVPERDHLTREAARVRQLLRP